MYTEFKRNPSIGAAKPLHFLTDWQIQLIDLIPQSFKNCVATVSCFWKSNTFHNCTF